MWAIRRKEKFFVLGRFEPMTSRILVFITHLFPPEIPVLKNAGSGATEIHLINTR